MFIPKYIYWELCNYCNLSCKHCFANSNMHGSCFADSELLWAKIVEINANQHVPIRFGGGEPFLYPGLFDLLEKSYQAGFPISITTNGTLLSNQNIENLKKFGLESLTISIDGTEKYHDKLRGTGNFARAVLGLGRAVEAQLKPSVSFTITSFNYENLMDYVALFYQKNIREFYFFRYIPDVSGKRSIKLALNKSQLMDASMTIKKLELLYPDVRFHYEKKGFLSFLIDEKDISASCKFVKGTVTIKYDGTVVVCAAISKGLGNIYTDSLNHIYETIAREIDCINCVPSSCQGCHLESICRGGCKSHSYICYEDYSHSDDCCYKELLKSHTT